MSSAYHRFQKQEWSKLKGNGKSFDVNTKEISKRWKNVKGSSNYTYGADDYPVATVPNGRSIPSTNVLERLQKQVPPKVLLRSVSDEKKAMDDWERHIKNKESGINYFAPKEAKELSPERTTIGDLSDFEKFYAGQIGAIRMSQDRNLGREVAKAMGKIY
jgi:hypothetical protein